MRHIEISGIVRTVYSGIFRHIQEHSAIFNHIQVYWGILSHIQAYSGITEAYWAILKTLCNTCIYNRAIFRTLTRLEPKASSKSCRTCKVIKHIQSPGIVKNLFKHFEGYSEMLIHIKAHTQARNQEGTKGLPSPFWKLKKRAMGLEKKGPDCVHFWVKFSIQNVVLRLCRGKTPKCFSARHFFLVFSFFDEIFIEVS